MEWRKVLIVSKTIAGEKYCVGGLDVVSKKPVRLLFEKPDGEHDMFPTEKAKEWGVDIGATFLMKYEGRKSPIPPHVEDCFLRDINLSSKDLVPDLSGWLTKNLPQSMIWSGGLGSLFGGKLEFNKWKAFIEQYPGPNGSVGFWRPSRSLKAQDDEGAVKYIFWDPLLDKPKYIKYVGVAPHEPTIAAGSLVRVSLARWWDNRGADPYRCYLQISGCYGGSLYKRTRVSPPGFSVDPPSPESFDDLPF